jgi:N-acetyl-gamma-glutamyl-phosphate reductase
MVKAAIIGGAGLSGLELIHLLSQHPHVEIGLVTSTKYAGRRVADAFPELKGVSHTFVKNDAALDGCEVAFLAIPNQASLEWAPKLLGQGLKVIDLSGVFRIPDVAVFRKFYNLEHTAQPTLKEAVFGLPEAFREVIRKARLVANPGCYPTGALLALVPLLAAGLIEPRGIVIDAKSGVTGAGRNVAAEYLFAEVDDNLRAYKIGAHRHAPEIEQELRPHAGAELSLIFVPHLLPIRRGILSTIYVRPRKGVDAAAIAAVYAARYDGERFVVLSGARPPEIRDVVGTNDCGLGWTYDERSGQTVLVSVIDNLGKGAAGQAIQNLNAMLGWPEATGIDHLAL